MNKHGSLFGGSLLVAGTSIGGGMLALPVLTSLSGFLPSLVVYFLCWLFMACTGLLFLEISLWMDKDANILSMAQRTLGTPGKIFAWILYLFLFYCLMVAYVVGCGNLIVDAFGGQIPDWLGPVLFLIFFGPFIYAGAKVVGKFNIFLMFGLAITFFAFLFLGFRYVDVELLKFRDWSKITMALPIAFTSFAYQGIIPTLVGYMDYDAKKTRTAILIGSFIPLVTYIIWQALIQGVIPTHGPGGLAEALAKGQNAVQPFKNFIQSSHVYLIGEYFAFFALVTSFFGVSLGLVDFLSDGLKIKKTQWGKLILCLMIFIPPLIIAYTHPHVFLTALNYAGGYGCALLLGLLPVMMVWSGRYYLGLSSKYALPGGRVVLILLAAFVLFELVCDIFY